MKTDYLQYTIEEVSSWLSGESKVKLPVVQRGFVWKVSQMECLWDSLFRGYPIGAMMMAREGDNLWLLDGQQRATTIALGFYNPWSQEMNRIGNATNLPVVWIDVCPQKKMDTFEYMFRVVTRSHPWGYQLQNNGSILGVAARRKANAIYKELFNQDNYTKLTPSQRLPYDAACPIPLCFLLEVAAKGLSGEDIVEMCKKNIPKGYRTSLMPEGDTYYSMLDKIDFSTLIKTVAEHVLTTKIPSIILPDELLIDRNDNATDESTLFVRLNSQGTRIEGEDLLSAQSTFMRIS